MEPIKDRQINSATDIDARRPSLIQRIRKSFTSVFRRRSIRKRNKSDSEVADELGVSANNDQVVNPRLSLTNDDLPQNSEKSTETSFRPPAKVTLFVNDFTSELKESLKVRSKKIVGIEELPTGAITQKEDVKTFNTVSCEGNSDVGNEIETKTFEEKLALFESQISCGIESVHDSLQKEKTDKDYVCENGDSTTNEENGDGRVRDEDGRCSEEKEDDRDEEKEDDRDEEKEDDRGEEKEDGPGREEDGRCSEEKEDDRDEEKEDVRGEEKEDVRGEEKEDGPGREEDGRCSEENEDCQGSQKNGGRKETATTYSGADGIKKDVSYEIEVNSESDRTRICDNVTMIAERSGGDLFKTSVQTDSELKPMTNINGIKTKEDDEELLQDIDDFVNGLIRSGAESDLMESHEDIAAVLPNLSL